MGSPIIAIKYNASDMLLLDNEKQSPVQADSYDLESGEWLQRIIDLIFLNNRALLNGLEMWWESHSLWK